MKHRLLTIGRSRKADIRLQDESVSRLHAEFIVAARGILHVADRSSANGTWVQANGAWKRIGQRILVPSDRLRFGRAEITAAELLGRIPERPGDRDGRRPDNRNAVAASPGSTPASPADDLPGGRVRRNPETGEVVGD